MLASKQISNPVFRMLRWLLAIFAFLLLLTANNSNAVERGSQENETITFVDVAGGISTTYWTQRRPNGEGFVNICRAKECKTKKEYFENSLYNFPRSQHYSFGRYPRWKGWNAAETNHNVQSGISQHSLDESESWFNKLPNGVLELTSVYQEKEKTPDGNFGNWTGQQNGFSHLVRSWTFPSYIEIVSYKARQNGRDEPKSNWERKENTITYFGRRVNNVTYNVKFRYKSTATQERLARAFAEINGVAVDTEKDAVRVTLQSTVLFDSGSADIKGTGLRIIRSVFDEVKASDADVIVAGHTDNVPIETEAFPSNWYLSSARALSVLGKLHDLGLDPARSSMEAFGETKPRADNGSAEGRSQNRRIEILLSFREG